MPIEASYMDLLKTVLQERFVPFLPPLLDQNRPKEEQDKKNISRAFSAFVLHHLCGISEEMAAKSVVDDFNDEGIDAILYHGDTLNVVQSKLKESEQFKQEEAHALCFGVRQLLRQTFDGFNQNFKVRQTEIEDAIESCSKIQIVIAHTGSGISHHALDAINQLLSDDSIDEERLATPFLDIDYQKVVQYLQRGNTYERIDVKIEIECHKFVSDPRLTYFGLIDLKAMVDLHQKYETGLYEKNIRTFLGMGLKQGVNESIQNTLRERPEDFFYLNNGITALCQKIEPKGTSKDGKKRFEIQGLSVINGAQTISSSSYAKSKGTDISKAKVMLTLIKADTNTEFGKAVTKARNHQNPVSLSDFVSLEEDQERLRREAAYLGIHYDYKSGTLEAVVDPTRINISEALTALALLHPDPRYAVWLKKDATKLYETSSTQYKDLFPVDLKIHTLINAVYFHRYIQSQMIPQVKSTNSADRLIYKHGNYALAWVLSKRLFRVIRSATLLSENDLATALNIPFDGIRNTLLNKVTPYLNPQNQIDVGPLALFKNQTHILPLLQDIMLENYGLASDPAIPHKQSQYIASQPYPIALFEYMVSKAPQITV